MDVCIYAGSYLGRYCFIQDAWIVSLREVSKVNSIMDKDRYPAEERRYFINIYVEYILSTVFWKDIPFWANALFCRTIYCVFFEKGRGGSTLGHVRSNQIEFKKKKEKQKRKRRKEDKREVRIYSRSCQIKPNWIKEKESKHEPALLVFKWFRFK